MSADCHRGAAEIPVVVSLTISKPKELISRLIIVTPARKIPLTILSSARRRSRQRDHVNCKNRWSIVRQSRERRVRFASLRGYSSSSIAGRTTRSLERRIPALKEHPPGERSSATGSYCLVVLLFRRVSPFQSAPRRLGAPRHEQSRAKNIPCEAPLRHFLSGIPFLLDRQPSVWYPRARRTIDIGDRLARCSLTFKSIQCGSRSPRNQQRDPNFSDRLCLRSTNRHSQESLSFFTRHHLRIASSVADRYSSSIHAERMSSPLYRRSTSVSHRWQQFSRWAERTLGWKYVRFLIYERDYSANRQSRDVIVEPFVSCRVHNTRHACGNRG